MYTAGITYPLTVDITPDTSAYADGDVIGGLQSVGPVPGATAGGYSLNGIALVDDDNEGTALDIHIFYQQPTSIADQAPFAPSAADLKKRVRKVAVAAADWETENNIKAVYKEDINDVIPAIKFWFYLVTNGTTPTFAASKTITVTFFVIA